MAKKKTEETITPEIPAKQETPASITAGDLVPAEKPQENSPEIPSQPIPVITEIPKPDNISSPIFEEIPATDVGPGQLFPETELESEEKRRPGRPKGSKTKSDSVIPVPQTDYVFMAESVFDMTTGIMAGGIGPEWHPRSPDERKNVCQCMANYFKAKEVKDIPPGLMLTIVVVAYCGPRLKEPSTAGKIKACWFWVKSKITRRNKQVA